MLSKGIDNACDIIRYAYDNGVNFFDTAYSSAVGKALDGISRDSYILSTKFPYNVGGRMKSADELEKNVDACLKELRTDYIDLYHLHAVIPKDYIEARDRFYPELVRMREKGKIRFAGFTELFSADTTYEALKLALADDLYGMQSW